MELAQNHANLGALTLTVLNITRTMNGGQVRKQMVLNLLHGVDPS